MADTIINLKIVYPLILLVITVILVKVSPITPVFAKEMRAELKARRAQAKAADAQEFPISPFLFIIVIPAFGFPRNSASAVENLSQKSKALPLPMGRAGPCFARLRFKPGA